MKRHLTAALVLALAAGSAAPALAQQHAIATIGLLRTTLVDLAPEDGIDPWIGLVRDSVLATGQVIDQQGNPIDAVQTERFGIVGFDDDYASIHAGNLENVASALLTLTSGWGFADATQRFHFLLSPNTQVVFSVNATLRARPEAPGVSWPTALAELYGSLDGFNDGERFSSQLRMEDGDQNDILSVTASSSGGWAEGRLAMEAYVVAESHALPVREPAPLAMLLGGLGLLAALRGQRWR